MIEGLVNTYKTKELLSIVKGNREVHKACVAEAREGYTREARILLENKISELKEKLEEFGDESFLPPLGVFCLAAPEDHTNEYDAVIRMFEMSIEDEIELTGTEFMCFVQDEWGWSREWFVANMGYSGSQGSQGSQGITGIGEAKASRIMTVASKRGYDR